MAYRNPAYLAKVAATVDIISEGRLEMGIGAGWYEHEWRAYGYGFPRAGERLQALDEGVQIFRQMWTTGSATLAGKHFQVDGARCYPQPLQGTSVPGSKHNGIPMWIAGGGEKKTLRIAAKYADYTNFDPTPEIFAAKSEILKGHCDDVGRDFGEIVRSGNLNVFIGSSEKEVEERFASLRARLLSVGSPEKRVDELFATYRQQATVGTPEQVVEKLKGLQALGLTYAILNFPEAAYDTTGMAMFERDVMPELLDDEEHGHLWHLPRRR
jgi:alkanesulfonate monooxygenase SsuD/methylene tetrahydromethanopterin reductase-like flavin-dependent oxidoreductase (luciferase family)